MSASSSSGPTSSPVIAKLDLGLERIQSVLALLHHPHGDYPCVHIAGTNGKGSVCTYIEYICRSSQLKVGKFVSPYLCYPSDAITINGEEIPLEIWKELSTTITQLNKEITTFELWTVIAFLYFSKEKVDVAIIEVGVGGRKDATNVIEFPAATVITSISNDHIELLGPTLQDIAHHKAGIIKSRIPTTLSSPVATESSSNTYPPLTTSDIDKYTNEDYVKYGVTVISPGMNPAIIPVIHTEAKEKNVILVQPLCVEPVLSMDDKDIQTTMEKYLSPSLKAILPTHTRWVKDIHRNTIVPLTLLGTFQIDNITVAINTVYALQKQVSRYPCFQQITSKSLFEGLAQVQWKGRLEWVTMQSSLVPPQSLPFLLDGGHNEGALPLVKETIRTIAASTTSTDKRTPVVFIYGATGSRSITALLPLLLEPGDTVYAVPFPAPDGMPWIKSYEPTTICSIIAELFPSSSSSITTYPCSSIQDAVNRISKHPVYSAPTTVRVCCGSLYLVAEAYRSVIVNTTRKK